MTGLLFTLAFFFVVGALAWRKLTQARAVRALERAVQRQTEVVREVSDYAAIDAAVDAARCGACDGKLTRTSEGPVDGVVVVQCHCRRCGQPIALRFRVPDA